MELVKERGRVRRTSYEGGEPPSVLFRTGEEELLTKSQEEAILQEEEEPTANLFTSVHVLGKRPQGSDASCDRTGLSSRTTSGSSLDSLRSRLRATRTRCETPRGGGR